MVIRLTSAVSVVSAHGVYCVVVVSISAHGVFCVVVVSISALGF